VAIGETGLDYYLPLQQADNSYSKAENQAILFQSLIKLAKENDLPLVVHTRQAQTDTLKFLKEAMPVRAVIHCFCGDENFLRECLDLGFLVSFTCNITYKKAQDLRNMVKLTPLDRLLLETDAPYLSPQEFRGRRNEPMHIKLLAQEISRLKGIDIEEIAQATTLNARDLFGIDKE
jgi:TatD DNase family protein